MTHRQDINRLEARQNPTQVTDDLSNFWRKQYPKIKTELSRRYPRHEWR
ncbi:MAG TPA: ATP-dependent helicase C-terminal domain-containing protein [Lacunisphaera sp.]|nr:ATP-dependent helicase C-terminal domain-containing protein [Lacunisphaera sp.]